VRASKIALHDLEKAAGNLGRLHAYLAARVSWAAEPEVRAALEGLAGTLSRTSETLGPLLTAAQVEPGESAAPGVEPRPPGALEATRLARFSGFLEQLCVWVESRSACSVPDGGRAALASIAAALDGAQRAVVEMLEGRSVPERPTPPPMPRLPPEPAEEPPPADIDPPPGGGEPLVLDPAGELPLLEARSGLTELSSEVHDLLDAFLTANGLGMSPAQRRTFGFTVRQRLEGAPEGHGLLIRVGALRGRLEPYFAYTPVEAPEDD